MPISRPPSVRPCVVRIWLLTVQKQKLLTGRVKTLHPGVHGGILARRDEEQHMAAIHEHSISPIDVVVVNLYPFRQTVTAEQSPSYETAVENIDIGRSHRLSHQRHIVPFKPSSSICYLYCMLRRMGCLKPACCTLANHSEMVRNYSWRTRH